jgi:transcriptional regulator with XRE-family HTH domain
MPVSVGRHNLARIRKLMKLTQADVARLAGCSAATIKAVEIGKLALSESLAIRLSHSLGIYDKDWLLKNDLTAPLPPGVLRTDRENTASPLFVIMQELFSRLCAVIAKMERGQTRSLLEYFATSELDAVKNQKEPIPDCEPARLCGSNAIEFFIQNPDLFDPDLREWINLEGLLKSNLKLSNPLELEEGDVDVRAKKLEKSLEETKAFEREMKTNKTTREYWHNKALKLMHDAEKARGAEAPSRKRQKA